jgi:lipoprotein-anchoring transpeptidase ErfK/SrfK
MRLLSFIFAAGMLACGSSAEARQLVSWQDTAVPAGTIVISQSKHQLFFVLDAASAIAYPVGVAKHGKEWYGPARVDGKYVQPAWSPPESVRVDHPSMPEVIQGGAPNNPMGVRALTLDRDEIAIHGTSQSMRASVGHAVSYGCIRMLNEDVLDLFARVQVGTPVVMTP